MNQLAVIFGLKGPTLSDAEKMFFRDANPWAYILFSRNIETPNQVKELTHSLRETVGRDCLIFVDQEGGRVQRFRAPNWPVYPSLSQIASLYKKSPSKARRAMYLQHRLIASDLRRVGVNADCAPVLDMPQADADPIISDRAMGKSPGQVIDLGNAALSGLMMGGVAPVIKHIPGHGRATVDSHKALPIINASMSALEQTDFKPFHALRLAPMAMTAHAIFSTADPDLPLTISKKAIKSIVRKNIGFDGLLMSDDLNMKALSGSLESNASAALRAGCDVVLQCSGDLPDMVNVAKGTKTLSGVAKARAEIARNCADEIDDFDYEAGRHEFKMLLGSTAAAA